MSSRMIINVKEVNDIVIPDTSAPDTGMFSVSHNDGVNTVAGTIGPIVGVVAVVLILAVLIAKLAKGRKYKKTNKFSVYSSRRVVFRFTGILMVVLLSTLAVLKYGEQKDVANAETRASDGLSITTEDINIDAELGNEPAFAVAKSIVKVDTATDDGYVLMAYVDSKSSDLTNETDTNSKSKISGLESSYSQVLKENTWGVALAQPKDQDSPVFRGLPTSEEEAMTVKVTGSVATEANDETVLYYATYVTPDLDEGKYTGATINYVAVPNVTTDDITVRFNIYDEETDTSELFNTVTYGMDCTMAYVGGNCQKAYAGKPMVYETPDNLIFDSENEEGGYYHIEPISVVGADLLKIEIDIDDGPGGDGGDYGFLMIRGAYSSDNAVRNAYEQAMHNYDNSFILYRYGSNMVALPSPIEFANMLYTENTAVTIVFNTSQVGFGRYHVVVTPIYLEEPADIETTETSVCRVIENDEWNSDWNVGDNTGNRAYTLDDFLRRMSIKHVTILGADKIRVEISYSLPPETLAVAITSGDRNISDLLSGSFVYPDDTLAVGGDTGSESGTEVFDFSGNTVTFFVMNQSPFLLEAKNVWFKATIYPLYNSEAEGVMPTQTCKFVNKAGEYREPQLAWTGLWSMPAPFYDDDSPERIEVSGEESIKAFLRSYYNFFRGQTIDVYTRYGTFGPIDWTQ